MAAILCFAGYWAIAFVTMGVIFGRTRDEGLAFWGGLVWPITLLMALGIAVGEGSK